MHHGRWAAILLLAGCFSDLQITRRDLGGHADGDGGEPGDDLAVTNLDGGGAADLANASKACALPHIQVLVRDGRSTSGLVKHGSVLRIPTDGRPPCAPLVLANSLDADNTSLGFFPPSTTIYGENHGKLRFLAQDDTEVQAPYTPDVFQSPDYIFSLKDPDGTARIAVAYDTQNGNVLGSTAIARVDVLDPADWSIRSHRWTIGADPEDLLRTDGVYSLGVDPRDDTRVVAFRFASPTYPTVALAAPFDGVAKTPTDWVASLDNADRPRRLRTWRSPAGEARAAWIYQAPTSAPGTDDRVVHRLEKSGSAPAQWGPVACADKLLCATPLDLYDAIPDPDDANAVLALCAVYDSPVTGADTSHLIRLHSDGSCETILRGDTLPESHYLTYLVAAVDPAQ